jgi:prepilin-type N-terminal cleavage/methylation domain-containing protein
MSIPKKLFSSLPILKSSRAFTLIELLVVIAIIAILSVMGFAAFTGITGRGNDDRRATDMKAIADALEVKKGVNTTYQSIFPTDFATGVFPTEPTGRTEKYCYDDDTVSIPNPAVSAWAGPVACPTGWNNVSGAVPAVSGTATYFKLCTVNEAKSAVICRGNRQ